MVINTEVIDNIIIFFEDLNKRKKSLILFKNIRDKKSTKNDHTPLCIATSRDGTCLISLKKSGCGIPHQKAAKQA